MRGLSIGGMARLLRGPAAALLCVVAAFGAPGAAEEAEDGERTSRISDEAVPLIDPSVFPMRPRPILELGDRFLGTGPLPTGFRLPGGAVWRPALLLFGTLRTAAQAFNTDHTTRSEWANRLDLYSNLQLSGTERLVVGVRPADQEGRFTGYNFRAGPTGSQSEFNGGVTTLFFEGDFGELFPNADPHDFGSLDWGFSVGRQPLLLQEGMLVNDDLDAVGITRNSILPRGGTNMQLTFLYAWNNVHRDDNLEDDPADLFGLFITADYSRSSINADFAYVFDTDQNTDGVYWGLSAVQRIGLVNTAFRVLGSQALDAETAAVSDGLLLFGEVSWTPAWTHDNVYVNAFWGIDQFSSAARGPATGGPLGRAGILFAAVGLGRYGAALGNRADDSAGLAVGYQKFSHDTRRQLIVEVGGRQGTTGADDGAAALGARFQQAMGKHFVLQVDGFRSVLESRDDGWGTRLELLFQF